MQQIEQSYLKRVIDLLEPVVGRDNLRATVTAEIDFSQTESDLRAVQAEPGRRAGRRAQLAELSESSNSAGRRRRRRAGRREQPAAHAAHRADQRRRAARCRARQGGSGRQRCGARRVTNYEVDKTVRVTRNATGTVKRLNAAVVVNHRVDDRRQGQDHAARRCRPRSSRS